MKMTNSKDGIMRATIRIEYRISEEDREVIAFATDMRETGDPPRRFRKATRAEVVDALRGGCSEGFWYEEEVEAYWERKGSTKSAS